MHPWLLVTLATTIAGFVIHDNKTCVLFPESLKHNGLNVDDAPAVHRAFDLCGKDGSVVFTNHTFHINSVLNTTNLVNCDVFIKGELRFSTDLTYWRNHSYPVVFQDQVTAWLFGGTNVTMRGAGGWYNGNGQKWYTAARNTPNQPGRPISITFYKSRNLLVDGLKIIQPQFWATFVWRSKNVTLANLVVNATSNNQWSTINTDGYNSWNSDTLVVENSVITNGDDCVAVKGNTTNLLVRNITCHGSAGMPIGSVGQYPTKPDYVQNITFENVRCLNCMDGAFIKTWQGTSNSDNLNGDTGGGGSGYIKNVTFRDFEMTNVRLPIQISQCIYTEDSNESCNRSKIHIEDINWSNIRGTSHYNIAASIYCSDLHPCPGIKFEDVHLRSVNSTKGLPMWDTNLQDEVYQCTNIVDQKHSGIPCNRAAPNNFSQSVTANVKD
ncbi:hypothetical protein NUU61_002356 [Penicillium alfredii]|uniref:galacturonan 1,4-alpha-galacturonidase n=1 Tax=Penicillium alfredii TaxID=1506179 RepID=A0A9W9FRE6_9EURO|nr:uncharacterized protein NUU61_002356 [Penicillium alfredii]KAJ5105009.1 hypothetical protein NUU61_002356 [Penicillium alfredii]